MKKLKPVITPNPDDRAASITATLKADSGYMSTETHRISANQWGRIVAIMNEVAA